MIAEKHQLDRATSPSTPVQRYLAFYYLSGRGAINVCSRCRARPGLYWCDSSRRHGHRRDARKHQGEAEPGRGGERLAEEGNPEDDAGRGAPIADAARADRPEGGPEPEIDDEAAR